MKKIFIWIFTTLLSSISFSQNNNFEALLQEGVILHDKGEFEAALEKYDALLIKDPRNIIVLDEKANSLVSLERFEEAITVCEFALFNNPISEVRASVYVTYSSALDISKNTKKSLKVLDIALLEFPNDYLLHYNKAVDLIHIKKDDSALVHLKKAVLINPFHGPSHESIGRIMHYKSDKIPSIMALGRGFILEDSSYKMQENVAFLLENILIHDIEEIKTETVKHKIVDISPHYYAHVKLPDNFKSIESYWATHIAVKELNVHHQFSDSAHHQVIHHLETMAIIMADTKEKHHGFFWDYYSPYFVDLFEYGHLEAFANLVLKANNDKFSIKWVSDNAEKINEFYIWDKNYIWNIKRLSK